MSEVQHRITRIETQKKNPDRVSVFLDGAFAFGVKRDVLVTHHLYEGDTVSEELLETVLISEEIARAKEKTIQILSYRARSVCEIRDKLKKKEYSSRVIDRVVQDFVRAGLLDDAQFAVSFARTKMLQKPMSRFYLKRELTLKGIDEESALHAVDVAYDNRSELDIVQDILVRKLNRLTITEENDGKIKKRLTDFVLRRGFGWPVVKEVIHDIWKNKT